MQDERTKDQKTSAADQLHWASMLIVILCAAALIAAATWAVYSKSFDGPFLFDDIARIANDPKIRSAWPPWPIIDNTNRPFAVYTFALNYAVHGYDVTGYHLTNLAIHVLAAWTLMGIVRRSWLLKHWGNEHPSLRYQALGLGFAVALLWAVHPLNTQAISYIVQRIEALMALFYLLTLYGFVRAQQSRLRVAWYLFSILCCAIGMGCKEVMVTAPVVVLWYDRAIVGKSWRQIAAQRWLYYGLLASTWLVLAWAMWHFQGDYRSGALLSVKDVSPWTYLTNQAAVITHYLQLVFYPANQCAYYSWPVEYSLAKLLPYLVLIGGLFVVSLWLCYSRPALGFVAMSFFIVLAPTSSVAPIIDLAFEHRMYLPLTAVVTLGCLLVGKAIGVLNPEGGRVPAIQWVIATGLLMLASSALGLAAHARNEVYTSEDAFWRDVTQKVPTNVNGWLGLGSVYAKDHNNEQAENCFRRALELAPDKARPQATYAGLLITYGQYAEAAELLEKAGQSEPNLVEYVINQGLLLSVTGKFAEAQPFLEAGVLSAPDDEELQTNLIVNMCYLMQFQRALEVAQANLGARPGSARATNDVAACLLANGDAQAAEQYARRAIELDPTLARAHATLGMAISTQGPREAIVHLQRACELDPQSYEFLSALANLMMAEDPNTAIVLYQKAVELKPSEAEARLRLAMAYDANGQPEEAVPLLEEVLRMQPELLPVKNYLRALRSRVPR